MKKIFSLTIICCVLFAVYMTGAETMTTQPELDMPSETVEIIQEVTPESPTDLVGNQVSELEEISLFIEKQSKGQAHLVIQALEPVVIWESDNPYYPVYVGEEWDDGHRINWYWFYVCSNSSNVYFNTYYTNMEELNEWRNSDSCLKEMSLIQEVLLDEGCEGAKLDSWIGVYTYSEYENTDQEMKYIATIYKIIDKLYVRVEICGLEICSTLKARVRGQEDKIDIIYRDTSYNLFDKFQDEFVPGDILFSLSKNETGICTNWDALNPESDSYHDRNNNYFQLNYDIKIFLNSSEYQSNLIAIDKSDTVEVIEAYNVFLNGRNTIVYNKDIKLVDDIMTIYNDKYTLYDVTGDGMPELILQGVRMYIITYDNGELLICYTDEHYGGQSYLVNGGNLYSRHGGIANRLMHAYCKLDDSGNKIKYYSVVCYAHYNEDKESWWETYTYDEGDGEQDITKGEYDEMVELMSNDDELDWYSFNQPESVLSFIRY